MALPSVSVDDRSYRDLLGLLRGSLTEKIWTDHNPSDPGIMLLELLAWLGDSYMYRMNRVSDTHRMRYLGLIMDPPEPVTANLNFEFTLSSESSNPLTIPAGFRVSTQYTEGKRFIFEVLQPLQISRPAPPGDPTAPPVTITVKRSLSARCTYNIENETLGTSSGLPNQSFPFLYQPVLADFVNISSTYNPNPVIISESGGTSTTWEHVQFLPDTLPDPSTPLPKLFRIDRFENRLCFGDGVHSAIPVAGAVIKAVRYRIIAGPEALVDDNTLMTFLDSFPPLQPLESIHYLGNSPAFGGRHHTIDADKISEGLLSFRSSFRLVTETDFKTAILEDFNEYQALAGRPERIIQAIPILDRKPPLHFEISAKGNVTLLLIPEFLANRESVDDPIMEEYNLLATDHTLLIPSPSLIDKIKLFLDERRLMCTRIHFVSPDILTIHIHVRAVIRSSRNVEEMRELIAKRIHRFLNIREGGLEENGWKLGQAVYRSHIYRKLGEIDGVEHVADLSLSPANIDGDIILRANSLPLAAAGNPVITIERTSDLTL